MWASLRRDSLRPDIALGPQLCFAAEFAYNLANSARFLHNFSSILLTSRTIPAQLAQMIDCGALFCPRHQIGATCPLERCKLFEGALQTVAGRLLLADYF